MNAEKVFSLSKIRKSDWKPIFLLGLPLLLICLNDSWIFSYVLREFANCWNFVDRWIYFGYFLDLKQHLNIFAKTYFGTRLPWILPGFLAYRLFSPIVAAYVLHLTFYSAALLSLYQILKQTMGKRTALVTAVLMGGHYFFLEAIGHDYIDGAGITYFLLTLLMLTKGIRSNFRVRLCLAGVFWGCAIYTQLFLIAYIPLLVIYYLFLFREHKKLSHLRGCLQIHSTDVRSNLFPYETPLQPAQALQSLLRSPETPPRKKSLLLSVKAICKHPLNFVTFGFVGLTLFLCTINYFLNGTFFFFIPIIKWTMGFVSEANRWRFPIVSWWKTATWLVFPTLIFFASVMILLFHRITRELPNRRFILFFQAYFILNVLIHVVWEIKMQQPVLQLDYYASYMLPAMFLAMGSQVAIAVHAMDRKWFYTLFGVVLAISFLPYAIMDSLHFHPMLWTLFFGIVGIMAILIRYKKVALLLLSISLALINVSAFNSKNRDPTVRDSVFQKNAFLSVIKSIQAVQSMDPQRKSLFWYNSQVPLGSIFVSVASTYLWAYRLVNDEFPQVYTKAPSRPPALGDQIFVLSTDPNVVEKANQNLAKIGLQGEFLDEKTIMEGPISYKITHLIVYELESDHADH